MNITKLANEFMEMTPDEIDQFALVLRKLMGWREYTKFVSILHWNLSRDVKKKEKAEK